MSSSKNATMLSTEDPRAEPAAGAATAANAGSTKRLSDGERAKRKERRRSMPRRLPSQGAGLIAGTKTSSDKSAETGHDWRTQTEGGASRGKWVKTSSKDDAGGDGTKASRRGRLTISSKRTTMRGSGNGNARVASLAASSPGGARYKRFSTDLSGSGGGSRPASTDSVGSQRPQLRHDFHKKIFAQPVTCMQCQKIIWGAIRQGFQCKLCKGTCHKKCMHKVKDTCGVDATNIDYLAEQAKTKLDIAGDDIGSIEDLVLRLKDTEHGIKLREHKTLLKVYPDSFTGAELIDWMLGNLRYRTRDECERFGSRLIHEDVIVAASGKRLKDSDALYFLSDDGRSPATSPRGSASSSPLGTSSGGGSGRGSASRSINGSSNGGTRDALSDVLSSQGRATYDDFEFGEMLGKGAFGKVMKVRKKDTGKHYAMKVLWKDKLNTKVLIKGIMAEKKIMMNSSPFLVHLHYAFQTPEKLFMCMDYVSGGTVKYHLDKMLALPIKVAKFWAAEIVIAVQFLHKCGFIYRDMKPDNLLIDHEGHICLADFGLSKELNHLDSVTSTICGTPCYLAPEVIDGKYKNTIDYWGLGVVVYEMISGVNPFEAKTFNEVLKKILHKKVQYPKEIFKDDVTIDFIKGCICRKPEERLQGDAIREHEFFKGTNWGQMAVRKVPSPFKIKNPVNEMEGKKKHKESPHVEHRRVKKEVFGDFSYATKNPYS